MLTIASLAAVLLYLIPVGVTLALRARRTDLPGDVALSIPLAVAADTLTVLTLTRLVPLETAALLSRPAWIGAAIVAATWKRARRPRGMSARLVAVGLIGAAIGVAVSLQLSRPYSIWDRHWHTPLTSSLRAQTIPFANVYDPHEPLTYHFAGNVVAAVLQTLSFGVLNASFALSIAHDVIFALTGATVALLAAHAGARSMGRSALAATFVLTAGPITLLRATPLGTGGYSFINYLSLSFRPHVSLGGLLFIGLLGTAVVRLARPAAAARPRTAVVFLACAALLGVTDEASLGMAALGLGVAWLVHPDAVLARRGRGALMLAAIPALLWATNVFFAAALSPGAPARSLRVVAWRLPGFYKETFSLASSEARALLAHDFSSLLLVAAGGVLLARAVRARRTGPLLAAFGAIAAAAAIALTRLDINGQPVESHRFVTAALLAAPLLGVAWIVAPRRATLAQHVGRGLVVGSLALSSLSTLAWLWKMAPRECERRHGFYRGDDFYAVDCRKATGATLFAPAERRYLAKRISYLYAGCMPGFVPGTPPDANWDMRINSPEFGPRAVAELDRDLLRDDEPLRVVCPARKTDEIDPVCDYATAHARCARVGPEIIECSLSRDERRAPELRVRQ